MAQGDQGRSPNVFVRALRSTVGRESTTFGFSILVTVVFGLVQRAQGSPTHLQMFAYATGAVLSFTLLEAVLSAGFRRPMPQHDTHVMALGTALNIVSVLGGLAVAWSAVRLLPGTAAWLAAPFVAGVAYLVLESLEAALAERVLVHAGEEDAAEVEA